MKSAYGMILSSKKWFLELQGYLTSEKGRFIRSDVDNALFIQKETDGSYTKMLVYIDDSLYFNSKNNNNMITELENDIQTQFKVNLQGHAHWFLSMRIAQDKFGNYTLDQSRYTKNLVKKHLGMVTYGNIKRPLTESWVATKTDMSQHVNEVQQSKEEYCIDYPSAIGSLIFLLNLQPDITFAVTKMARFMRMPGKIHYQGLIRLLGYLQDNSNFGIKFYKNVKNSPIMQVLNRNGKINAHTFFRFCKSSWQDCMDTGRSTGLFILFYLLTVTLFI